MNDFTFVSWFVMGRKGRTARIRARNAAYAREKLEEENARGGKTSLNALQFSFAVIVNGASFATVERVFLENNILPPSKSSFYSCLGRVSEAVIGLAKENALLWRAQVSPGACISLDGCWDHRRNGRYCIVAAIEQLLKKVIAIGVCQRSTAGHQTPWKISPQNMESVCVQQIAAELREDTRIVAYCHDNDSRIRSLLKRMCPHWHEKLDPNHTVKTFTRLFEKFNKQCGGKLADIEASLIKFMYFLIDFPVAPSEKVKLWENTINHFSGDHTKCLPHRPSKTIWKHADDQGAREALAQLLAKSSFIIERCQKPYSTQLNECLHSIKSHIMPKELAWRATAFGRLYLSILIFNNAPNWKEGLRLKLGLPELRPEVCCRLRAIETIRRAQRGRRSTAQYKEKEQKRRSRERGVIARQDTSFYVGTPKRSASNRD